MFIPDSYLKEAFENFQLNFNKNYTNEEKKEKFKNFKNNYEALKRDEKIIKNLNFEIDINKFSDENWGEFRNKNLMKIYPLFNPKNYLHINEGRNLQELYLNTKNNGELNFETDKNKNKTFKFNFNIKDNIENSFNLEKDKKNKFNASNFNFSPIKTNYKDLDFSTNKNIPKTLTISDLIKTDKKVHLKKTKKPKISLTLKKYPQKKTWRKYDTIVQDQADCASCYIFSAISSLEIQYRRKFGFHSYFSEQEILDCSKNPKGCEGGNPYEVFKYINKNGISYKYLYPYKSKKNEICNKKKNDFGFKQEIKLYFIKDPVELIIALNHGPVVLIHHANDLFKKYKFGVFDDPNCDGELNHSALAIGYDLEADVPFVVLKNAWGHNWGDGGYYKIGLGDVVEGGKGVCQMFEHGYNILAVI